VPGGCKGGLGAENVARPLFTHFHNGLEGHHVFQQVDYLLFLPAVPLQAAAGVSGMVISPTRIPKNRATCGVTCGPTCGATACDWFKYVVFNSFLVTPNIPVHCCTSTVKVSPDKNGRCQD